jgi:pantothenate kinase
MTEDMNLTTKEINKVYQLTKDIGLEEVTRIVLALNNLQHLEQDDKKTTVIKNVFDHAYNYSLDWEELERDKLDAMAIKVMLVNNE